MRAVLLDQVLKYVSEYPEPVPRPDEALVRVRLAGVCSTDLELVNGYYGFQGVLGHEFVGEVEDASERSWIGRRVVSTINVADRTSPQWAEYGDEHHPDREVVGIVGRDGVMADYVALPVRNLLEVPETVSDEAAVFTEPLAAALRICDQLAVRPSARIAIIGPGRLGMLVGGVLARLGSQATMLGRTAQSLELPRRWGLSTDLVSAASTSCFDMVVDATGSPDGLEQAIRIARPRGTVVLKSTYAHPGQVDLTKLVVDEIRIVGSRCGPFPAALRLLQTGDIPVESLIDDVYPIAAAGQAFARAAEAGVRKILLQLTETADESETR